MKYSVNPNLNAVMNSIEKLLLSKGKDKQESIQIIKRYIKSFPKEPDYNLAQHGGMLVSPYDVRELNAVIVLLFRTESLMGESGMNTCCG